MVHAKNYETGSTFQHLWKLFRENCGLFFPDTVYIKLLGQEIMAHGWSVEIIRSSEYRILCCPSKPYNYVVLLRLYIHLSFS